MMITMIMMRLMVIMMIRINDDDHDDDDDGHGDDADDGDDDDEKSDDNDDDDDAFVSRKLKTLATVTPTSRQFTAVAKRGALLRSHVCRWRGATWRRDMVFVALMMVGRTR